MFEFPQFITGLPQIELPWEGVSGHLLQSESQQVAFIRFDRDTDVPAHTHRSQWELVVAGEVDLRTAEGTRTYTAGESFYLPEGVEHGALVKAGYRAVIFFDQPDRYRTK